MKNTVDTVSPQSALSPTDAIATSPLREKKIDAEGETELASPQECAPKKRGSASRATFSNGLVASEPEAVSHDEWSRDSEDDISPSDTSEKLPEPRRQTMQLNRPGTREAAPFTTRQRKSGKTRSASSRNSAWCLEEDTDEDTEEPANSPPEAACIDDRFEENKTNADGRQKAGGKSRHPKGKQDRGRDIDGIVDDEEELFEIASKANSKSDRVHYLAMAVASGPALLRSPKLREQSSLTPPRPKSRAECERRCGSDGFCDPSNLLGCGGEHCGRQLDL